jgi:hypothetical protein
MSIDKASVTAGPGSRPPYGHGANGEAPYILSVRLKLSELDALAKSQKQD